MVVETSGRQKSRRLRIGLALASLALLPWGAAAFTLAAGAAPASASTQETLQDHDFFLRVERDGQVNFVRINMLVATNGAGAVDEAGLAAAKAEIVARFPGAVPIEESAFSAQFVTSGFKWTANTASWAYNGAGAPASVASAALSAVSSSASTWGSGSNFHFSGGGSTSAGTGACGGGTDGLNTIGWANQSGSVLAVTCSWYGAGSPFGAASEFDMQIDPGWTWTVGGSPNIDLQSVVTHEFGHALGLNHSSDPSAVMYPSYGAGSIRRTLGGDDVAGMVAIYGAPGGAPTNTPTSTPTTPASTATSTPTRTPTPTTAAPTSTPTTTGLPPTATPTVASAPPTATSTVPSPTATATPPTAVSPTATPTPGTTPESGAPATATATPIPTGAATATPTNSPTRTPTTAPTLPIGPGSNLLAWPGSDQATGEALGGHGGSLKIVYEWDPGSGEWKRYAPGLPAFVNNLSMMRRGHSYWFIARAALKLPF